MVLLVGQLEVFAQPQLMRHLQQVGVVLLPSKHELLQTIHLRYTYGSGELGGGEVVSDS